MENALLVSSHHHRVENINFDLKMGFANSWVFRFPLCVDIINWSITHACQPFLNLICGCLPWLAGWLDWLLTGKHEVFSFAELAAELWFLCCHCRLCWNLEPIISTHSIIVYFLEHLGWVGAAACQAQKDLLQSALAHAVVFKAQNTLLPLQGCKHVCEGYCFLRQTVLHPHHVFFLKNGAWELGLHELVEERDSCQGCTLQLNSVTWRIDKISK